MANIQDFINEMQNLDLHVLALDKDCAVFDQVAMLSQNESDLRKNCLYVGNGQDIDSLSPTPEHCLFLLVEDGVSPEEEFKSVNTVILSGYAQNANILFLQSHKWLSEYTVYLENSNQLLRAFLEHRQDALHHLIDTASGLLRNPLVVLDANCGILTASSSYQVEDALWLQNLAMGYCSYGQIIELQSFFDSARGLGPFEPLTVVSSSSTTRLCISKLILNQENMGTMIVFEAATPLSKMNRKLFSLIAEMAASTIYNYYEAQRTSNEHDEDYIFIECLSGKLRSYGNFLERIKNTPFQTPSVYHVIAIDVEHFENFDPKKEVLRSYFSTLFKRSWMLWYQGNVIAIVDISGLPDVAEALKNGIPFFKEKSLRLAISDTFDNIFYIEKFYRQAMAALRFSTAFHPDAMFSYYNDYKFYSLMDAVRQNSNLAQFFDNRLRMMQEYDKANNTDYYETVREFLFCSQNLLKTSLALHVHKNTVSYRITKAKTLFGIDFDDADTVFQLMYSYKIQQLFTSLPGDDKRAAFEKAAQYPYEILC